MLTKISVIGFVLCLGLCAYMAVAAGYAKDFCDIGRSKPSTQTAMNNDKTVFACIPSALTREQRERSVALARELIVPRPGLKELPDGYSLSYTANEQNIKDVAEFVAYERLCCPFMNFEIVSEGENLSLHLKGPEGAKEFIKAEFGV